MQGELVAKGTRKTTSRGRSVGRPRNLAKLTGVSRLRLPEFKSQTGFAVSSLQRELVAGTFLPGARLPIVSLAERYGVSPGAIREALSRLTSEGLVEFNEQRGFRAAAVSPQALDDITRTRLLIDTQAMKESIRRGDVNWEAEVLSAHHRLMKAPQFKGDDRTLNEVWLNLHREFHRALINACASDWLIRFHDILFDQTIRYRSLESVYSRARRSDARRDVNGEHAEIVKAVLARDENAAAQALERHYLKTKNLLLQSQDQKTVAPKRRTKRPVA
jgi:DNA-binding GntR family transcriptional regulator